MTPLECVLLLPEGRNHLLITPQRNCRACFPTCISQLTSFAVTTSRTTSTLHDLSPPLLSRVLVTQTGVVELRRSLAGIVGVSPIPIIDWSLKPYISPVVLSKQVVTK